MYRLDVLVVHVSKHVGANQAPAVKVRVDKEAPCDRRGAAQLLPLGHEPAHLSASARGRAWACAR